MTREEAIHEIKQWDFINNDEMEALRTLIPELRESEDERIWKAIDEIMKHDKAWEIAGKHGLTAADIRRWVKKQKEHNGGDEECTDFTIYHPLKNGKGKYECIPYSFHGSLTSFSEDKNLIDFLRTCFYTEEECNEWIEQQEEQKPAEWNDTDMKEARDNLISVCRDWESGKKTTLLPIAAVRARFFLEHLTEPKEWSEDIIRKSVEEVGLTQHQIDWFKTNVFPPPKQEWSEEDERILKGIIGKIDHDQTYGVSKVEMLSFLKSLRPQPKADWSEEDEKHINLILRVLDIQQCWDGATGKKINPYQDEIDWLKSLRPRPHWKPSEEQMSSLKQARDYYMGGRIKYVGRHLSEIAEQLEKRM